MTITRSDEIQQSEISAFRQLDAIRDAMALGFRRRLKFGAAIQSGNYTINPATGVPARDTKWDWLTDTLPKAKRRPAAV